MGPLCPVPGSMARPRPEPPRLALNDCPYRPGRYSVAEESSRLRWRIASSRASRSWRGGPPRNDLVITSAGIKGLIFDIPCRQTVLVRESDADRPGEEVSIGPDRRPVGAAFPDHPAQLRARGAASPPTACIGEAHVKGRGYPWSFIPDYDPDLFLTVLKEFNPEAVVPPARDGIGIYRLHLPTEADSPDFRDRNHKDDAQDRRRLPMKPPG